MLSTGEPIANDLRLEEGPGIEPFMACTHQLYTLPSTKSWLKVNVVPLISLSSQDLYFNWPLLLAIVTTYPVAFVTGFQVNSGLSSDSNTQLVVLYKIAPSAGLFSTG